MDFSRLSLYCPYPVVFQWASRRFLNELTEVASTTCWGRLFQALMTLWLKKFFLRSRRDLLKVSLRLWPRRPCVFSERWKNWCWSIFSPSFLSPIVYLSSLPSLFLPFFPSPQIQLGGQRGPKQSLGRKPILTYLQLSKRMSSWAHGNISPNIWGFQSVNHL